MAASSSQPETMKAECSLDNPKVHSFYKKLYYIINIPITLYIKFAIEENFMINW